MMVKLKCIPTYKEVNKQGEEYKCLLHPMQCAVKDCNESTLLHPVCPYHADTVYGVEVKRSTHTQGPNQRCFGPCRADWVFLPRAPSARIR